jgi:LacI family transcriptional regulator
MQGMAQACNAHNHLLSLFLFHTQAEEEKITLRVLRKQLVDGVILSALPVDDPLLPRLIENNVPFVMIGRPAGDASRINFVDIDNVAGAYSAVSYLIRLGYKHIAAITGPLNTTVGLDRRQGYLTALNEQGCPIDETLIVEGDFTEASGYMAMQQLLLRQPEAVFVASDTMAQGALRALRSAGLTVPNDIGIIGFDDLPASTISDPPLTTVRQPIRRVGAQAVEILLDNLTNDKLAARQMIMTTELVIRASCRQPHDDL